MCIKDHRCPKQQIKKNGSTNLGTKAAWPKRDKQTGLYTLAVLFQGVQ